MARAFSCFKRPFKEELSLKHKVEYPVAHPVLWEPMGLEQRRKLLPPRNVCSLYPAKRVDDALTTGNGRQRIRVMGEPYEERLAFTHELLFEPKWAKTPGTARFYRDSAPAAKTAAGGKI